MVIPLVGDRFPDDFWCAGADRDDDRDICPYRNPDAAADDPDDGRERSACSRRTACT